MEMEPARPVNGMAALELQIQAVVQAEENPHIKPTLVVRV
jgi:hypothetical protein